MKKTIYLCGGINGLSDADATDWREATKEALGERYDFLDPMRRDFRGLEAGNERAIIEGDLQDIADSDVVLVNAARPSWGTAMECFHAKWLGRHVVTVCPAERPSPWLVGHSDRVFRTFAAAYEYLAALPEAD